MSSRLRLWMAAAALAPSASFAIVVGFVQDFSGSGNTGGFFSGSRVMGNPGTGGVGGAGDGYLSLDSGGSPANYAAAHSGADFNGNLTTAGVTGFSLYLNDLGTADNFSIHIGIGIGQTNFWIYNPAFTPLNNSWSLFYVDVTNGSNWTQVQGGGTFAAAKAASNRFHIRHDVSPFGFGADVTSGDIGVDRITVVPEASSLFVTAGLLASMLLHRRRTR